MITRLLRRRRRPVVRTVTLTLFLGGRGWTEGAHNTRERLDELGRTYSYHLRIAQERARGRAYISQLMYDWRTELGLPDPAIANLKGPPGPTWRHQNIGCDTRPRIAP